MEPDAGQREDAADTGAAGAKAEDATTGIAGAKAEDASTGTGRAKAEDASTGTGRAEAEEASTGAACREADAVLTGALPDDAAVRRVVEILANAHPSWGWVGVYLLVGDTLVLGPFVGPPTEHRRIPVGTGVCGTAIAEERNVVVDDVRTLDNYLACSIGTRSEIVVLIRDGEEIVGQFDVDSDDVAAFGPVDEALLEHLAALAGPRCRRLAAALA